MLKTGKAIKSKTIISKSKSKVKSGTTLRKASKKSKKERSTNFPSWAAGSEPRTEEYGKEYAKRR